MQVAAAEEFAGHRADNRPPRAVALGITLVIGAFELRVITLDDPVQRRLPRLTRAIDGTTGDHVQTTGLLPYG